MPGIRSQVGQGLGKVAADVPKGIGEAGKGIAKDVVSSSVESLTGGMVSGNKTQQKQDQSPEEMMKKQEEERQESIKRARIEQLKQELLAISQKENVEKEQIEEVEEQQRERVEEAKESKRKGIVARIIQKAKTGIESRKSGG